jgi:hypothetical protein
LQACARQVRPGTPGPPAPPPHTTAGRPRPVPASPDFQRLLEPAPSSGPPHLVLPGRVAPQHLAPDRDFEGPVSQLRLRRLLLPPPAAHPPVAPPGPGLGRAGRAKGSRSLRCQVTARGGSHRLSGPVLRRTAGPLSLRSRPALLAPPSRRRGGRGSAMSPSPADAPAQPIDGHAAVRTEARRHLVTEVTSTSARCAVG